MSAQSPAVWMRILLLAPLLLTALMAGAQTEPKSVSYLINPNRNASITSPSLRLPLEMKWNTSIPGDHTYPVIADRRIFFGTKSSGADSGFVICLDQVDGHIIWAVPVSSGATRQSVAYENGTLFWLSGNGWCYGINPVNGNVLWFQNSDGITTSTAPLTVKSGIVYFTGSIGLDHKIFALRAADGSVLWSRSVPDPNGIPSATNEGLYVSFNTRNVIKFDLLTGAVGWQYDSGAGTTNGLAIPHGDVVYLQGFPGRRLDAFLGTPLAGGIPPGNLTVGPMSLRNGLGFHHQNHDTLIAWDIASNLEIWRRTINDYYNHYPIAINDYIFLSHPSQEKLSAFSASTGETLWSGNAWGVPSSGNEWITTGVLTRSAAGEGLILVPFGSTWFCFASTVYSLTDPPTNVWPGDSVPVTWLVPGGRPQLDWVGLFKQGADNHQWIDYRYTNGATLGTAAMQAPLEPGNYEYRYLLNNGYTSTTSTSPFTVDPINATLNVTPSTGTAGVTVFRVDFTAPAGRPANDWLALYKVGETNRQYRWWGYANGAQSGTLFFGAPDEGGTYEVRYLINNGYDSVAVSNTISITALDPSQFTLTADPATVSPGGALSVSFTAPPGRHAQDWISLFKVGDPNRSYGWWRYTNGAESGTFNLTAPLQQGQYEFRYLLEDGYISIKTSNPVTVQ